MPNLQRADLIALLSSTPPVSLVFDTNAIFGDSRNDPFINICDKINRINEQAGDDIGRIRMLISAPVYVEKLQDLRSRYKDFKPALISDFLVSKRIEVVALEQTHAEHIAAMLGHRFAGSDEWRAFKKGRCLQCLGLPRDQVVSGSGKQCGATIDWLVAGHADAEHLVLVTDDADPEFDQVRRKTQLGTLAAAVEELLPGSP
jgi:hypothetical protein